MEEKWKQNTKYNELKKKEVKWQKKKKKEEEREKNNGENHSAIEFGESVAATVDSLGRLVFVNNSYMS
jgi:transaldolase